MKLRDLVEALQLIEMTMGDADVLIDYEDTSGYARYPLESRMIAIVPKKLVSCYVAPNDGPSRNDLTETVVVIHADGYPEHTA